MNNFEKLFSQNRLLIDIAPEHCFEVPLAAFQQIINNGFIQLETEWLNDINHFSRESNKFRIIWVTSLKASTCLLLSAFIFSNLRAAS